MSVPRRSRLSPPRGVDALDREALRAWVVELGHKAFRGDQLFGWLHRHGARDVAAMKNLPGPLRDAVADELTTLPEHTETLEARDGTRKLLFRTADGHRIESVLIPMGSHYTQCLSSQVGCRLGCGFCLTAKMGLTRHLSAAEIVAQVQIGRRADLGGVPLKNYVFMGMGEPLDNFDEVVAACRIMTDPKGLDISSRRITVSTVGLAARIPDLGHAVPVNLAVSLNASDDEQREAIMPVDKRYPMATLRQALIDFPLPPRRRITIEYVMLGGFNDTAADARRLARFLQGLPVKVNLIPWNPFDGAAWARPTDSAVRTFQELLLKAGLATSVRISKGLDIGAACGQLDGVPAVA